MVLCRICLSMFPIFTIRTIPLGLCMLSQVVGFFKGRTASYYVQLPHFLYLFPHYRHREISCICHYKWYYNKHESQNSFGPHPLWSECVKFPFIDAPTAHVIFLTFWLLSTCVWLSETVLSGLKIISNFFSVNSSLNSSDIILIDFLFCNQDIFLWIIMNPCYFHLRIDLLNEI